MRHQEYENELYDDYEELDSSEFSELALSYVDKIEERGDQWIAKGQDALNTLEGHIDRQHDRLQGTLGKVQDTLGAVQNTMAFAAQNMNSLADIWERNKAIDLEAEKVKAWSDREITNIIATYQKERAIIEHTFGERDKALSQHYKTLDRAIERWDRDIILQSMQNISHIVAKSPLDDFANFSKAFDDKSQPLLDF